jgi:hypothetical protein
MEMNFRSGNAPLPIQPVSLSPGKELFEGSLKDWCNRMKLQDSWDKLVGNSSETEFRDYNWYMKTIELSNQFWNSDNDIREPSISNICRPWNFLLSRYLSLSLVVSK